ncbi:hypothetical protein DVH05_008821 [Phytophthora capsici]|nr:hypothetical protein DVH05_008821 [Phytophthora capsici]
MDTAILDIEHWYIGLQNVSSAKVNQLLLLLNPLEEDRFLFSFAHIFAGGYAAGYYSYKWAEILSCAAYGAFEEAAKESPEAQARVGRKFRDTILARGGGQHPEQVAETLHGAAAHPVRFGGQVDTF